MYFGDNQGKRTEFAKQAIIRYIWDKNLQEGDRIPAQSALCRLLNAGSATIDRAVKSLVNDGVLEARKRTGVFVRMEKPEGYLGRSVGVIGQVRNVPRIFNWTLANALQTALQARGCLCVMFPFRDRYHSMPVVSDFLGLETALSQRTVHGLISISDFNGEKLIPALEKFGLPVCFGGPPSANVSGVFIDTPGFMLRGLDELRSAGCRKPWILIGPGPVRNFSIPRVERYLAEWDGGRLSVEEVYREGYALDAGQEFARTAMSLPPEERPDGVVLCDDIIAQGFFSELVRLQYPHLTYLPQLVCLRNKESQIDFPARFISNYEVNPRLIADLLVEQLLKHLQSGQPATENTWIFPEKLNSNLINQDNPTNQYKENK